MAKLGSRRRAWRIGASVCAVALWLAPGALAADTINITRFSRTVTGNSGVAGTGVAVNLLRNTQDINGAVVRQQVDTFTTTADGSGAWSGSFSKHAFSTSPDQIEVTYTGAGAPPAVTIGAGNVLPSATRVVVASASAIDGRFGVSSDGMKLKKFSGAFTFKAAVNGVAAPAPVGSTITFAAPVTNADAVAITATFTALAGTIVTLADAAPLLSVVAANVSPPDTSSARQPACTLYLVTGEVVCFNLTPASTTMPASYTLTQLRGGAPVASQTLTVPARSSIKWVLPSVAASAPFASVVAGDQFQLKFGAPPSGHVLSTLTVNPMTYIRNAPFGDLENGASTIVTGTCTAGVFFNDSGFFNINGNSLCPDGTIPAVQNIRNRSTSLSSVGSVGRVVGQLDDTSAGSTEIDMPGLAIRTPISSESIFTPFSAFAFVRYNDPGALAAAANNAPANGPTPVVPALLSNAPVAFSFAPLGSASFTALGNANQPGGALIPALAKGAYVDRFTLTDSRGDVNAFESSFVAQENAPTGPAATKCSAKSSGGLKASIAAGKSKGKSKGKKKRKPKSSQITVTLSCSAAAAGGHVAVWLQRGSSLVANGRGAVTRRVARITMKGKFPRGTYRVTEVLEAGGQATESTEILTLR